MPISQERLNKTVSAGQNILSIYIQAMQTLQHAITNLHLGHIDAATFELLVNDVVMNYEIMIRLDATVLEHEAWLFKRNGKKNAAMKELMRRRRAEANGGAYLDFLATREVANAAKLPPGVPPAQTMKVLPDEEYIRGTYYERRHKTDLSKADQAPYDDDGGDDDDGYNDTYIPPPKSPFGQSPIPSALRAKPGATSPIPEAHSAMPDMTDNSPISTYKMSAKDYKRSGTEYDAKTERAIRVAAGLEPDEPGIGQDVNPFTGKREGEA